jgi:hypothetical protein
VTDIENPNANDFADDVSLTACATRSTCTTAAPESLGDAWGRVRR